MSTSIALAYLFLFCVLPCRSHAYQWLSITHNTYLWTPKPPTLPTPISISACETYSTLVLLHNTLSQYCEYNTYVLGHQTVTPTSQPDKQTYLNKGFEDNLLWSKSNTSLPSILAQYLVGPLPHLGWNSALKEWLHGVWRSSRNTWVPVPPL